MSKLRSALAFALASAVLAVPTAASAAWFSRTPASRTARQLRGLSQTWRSKLALLRDRSLDTSATRADIATLARYMKGLRTKGNYVEIGITRGMWLDDHVVLNEHGAVRGHMIGEGNSKRLSARHVEGVRGQDVVHKLRVEAAAVRAGLRPHAFPLGNIQSGH